MNRNLFLIPGLWLALTASITPAHAQVTLFADNFESGNLNQWTGKSGGAQHGQIVADPFNPSNHVVNFFAVNFGGDMFSAAPVSVDSTRQRITLGFDFLALPIGGVPPQEYGGFAALAGDNTGNQSYFVGGTVPSELNVPPTVATVLTTNGLWKHYEIDVTDAVIARSLNSFLITFEDWESLGRSIPGDVYFDNVKLTAKLDPAVVAQLVPCDGPISGGKWKNHGQYVSAMDAVTTALVTQNLITAQEQIAYVSAAAASTCGKN
jgi:hypothetical protein